MNSKRHGFDDNIIAFAVRFADLRHSKEREGERVKSFQQISEEIFKKTGVYISHAQLSKYENMEDGDKKLIYPKINIILAIARYYDVSVEYLMGLTDSKSKDIVDQYTAVKFGLSDKSMALLRAIAWRASNLINSDFRFGGFEFVSPELINFIFENENFWTGLDRLLASFIKRKRKNKDTEKDGIDSARYILVRRFEKLLDDITESCEFIPADIGHKRYIKQNRHFHTL